VAKIAARYYVVRVTVTQALRHASEDASLRTDVACQRLDAQGVPAFSAQYTVTMQAYNAKNPK